MHPLRATAVSLVCLFVALGLVGRTQPVQAQSTTHDSQLAAALDKMYDACLFTANGPFSQAVNLAQQSLAPGISSFIESNLAAIPLTPPSLDAEYVDGQITTFVTGFTPIYTESSATVGKGQFLVGTNFSYFNLTKIRGEDMSDLFFAFRQDNGSDVITVNMPFSINASVFTLYGTYGITNRLDIGFALPIVRLGIERQATTFEVTGNQTGCLYTVGCDPNNPQESDLRKVDYTFAGGVAIDFEANGEVEAEPEDFPTVPESETYLNTAAVRAKYRFPTSLANGRLAAVVDLRLPVGRGDDNILGKGRFGARVMLIGEYNELDSFKPYLNVGAQFWNGTDANNLRVATGFTQRVLPKVFFAFDLLGELDIEDSPFLAPIDEPETGSDATGPALSLAQSSIPAFDRDHTLNAGLGLQVAVSPSFQIYGSGLFSLLSRGLQAPVAPTVGAAFYF